MNYLIGIDAGGTKTEIIAYGLDYNPIFRKIGGFGNPAVNLDKTLKTIVTLIEDCTSVFGRKNCQLIVIGMAAVETGNYVKKIKMEVENIFTIETIVLNDAELACKAYLGSKDGMLVIAGTGSSCFVQKSGEGEIVGGWSHILGDEGSGYYTVIEVFKNIVNKYDRNISYDSLSKAMLEKIGGSSRSDIMNFIYSNEKNTIAGMFPTIVDFSLKGDLYAINLLENAGKYLADLTCVAYRKKDFRGKVTIGIKGGVFQHSTYMVSAYMNEIQKHLCNFDIINEDISATKGVCEIYDEYQK